MGADLLCGPAFVGHVFYAEINELLFAFVFEFPIGIAPLAIFLVEGTVRFFADGGIVKRHPAALADQLSRGAKQRIDRNVKNL